MLKHHTISALAIVRHCVNGFRGLHVSTGAQAKIGFIGVGRMGAQIASNLLRGGNQLVVYDTNRAAVRPFILADADVAGSPAELASKVDRVVTMLPSAEAVLSVYLGHNGLIASDQARKDSLLIDSSTVDPATAKQIETAARHHGLDFVDAPVIGSVASAQAGELAFLVGAQLKNLNAVRQLLSVCGKTIIHCGPVGSGQAAALANNMMYATSVLGMAQTLDLAKQLGLDPQLLTQILNKSSCRSWLSHQYNRNRDLQETTSRAMETCTNDLNLVQSMAVNAPSATPMGELASHIYRVMANNEVEHKDFSYLYQFLQQTTRNS